MPWEYHQRSGILTSPNGQEYQGYSGYPPHRNAPAAEAVHNEGPIPRGTWAINLTPTNEKGPLTLRLTPIGHNAHGRSGFLIHGDSTAHPGAGSTGCIVVPRTAREAIIHSGVSTLEVREL